MIATPLNILAANLRRQRHEKGLAQDDLAYEAEVSRSTFYAGLKILEKLAKALNVDNRAAKSD
jgi:transcriptional regulator with XRE-family HTH domain